MSTHAQFANENTYREKNIFASDYPRIERKVTILSGQNIVAGTVLGVITASGKLIKSLSAASDGSQTPDAILAHDVDATGGDKEAIVYQQGDFVTAELTIGTAHTASSIKAGLRAKSIFLT